MTNMTHKFLSMYLFLLFNSLHVSSTSCSSSGETNCVNTTSGSCQSVLVAMLCAGMTYTQHGHEHRLTATRGCIDTICLSWWWARCVETCRQLNNKNKYIERNLCVTLVIYQGSLHDAWSTKYKINVYPFPYKKLQGITFSAHPHTIVNTGIHTVNASVSEGDTFILMGRQAVLGGGKQIAMTKK